MNSTFLTNNKWPIRGEKTLISISHCENAYQNHSEKAAQPVERPADTWWQRQETAALTQSQGTDDRNAQGNKVLQVRTLKWVPSWGPATELLMNTQEKKKHLSRLFGYLSSNNQMVKQPKYLPARDRWTWTTQSFTQWGERSTSDARSIDKLRKCHTKGRYTWQNN